MSNTFSLHHQLEHPKMGFGTYKLNPDDVAYDVLRYAIDKGIRHFDSAIIYRNEKALGQAIRDSGFPREAFFITSKLPPHIKHKDGVLRMFERSLKNLGFDYLDAYIINAPGPFDDLEGDYDEGNIEVYQTLETLYHEGRVKAIGVSQFPLRLLKLILERCEIVPHIHQISYFIGHTRDELVTFAKEHNILIQAFSPLAKGYLLTNPTIIDVAKRYDVTPATIALNYILQKGHAPIPKAARPNHVDDFYEMANPISSEDMALLDQIKGDPRQYDD